MNQWRHPKPDNGSHVREHLEAKTLSLSQRLQSLPSVTSDAAFVDAINESNQLPIPNDLVISLRVPNERTTGISYQKWASPMIDQIKWLSSHLDKDREIRELHVLIETHQPTQLLIRHLINRITAHFEIAKDARLTLSVPLGANPVLSIDDAQPFSHLHIDFLTPIESLHKIEGQWLNQQRGENTSLGLTLGWSHQPDINCEVLADAIRQMIWLQADRLSLESLGIGTSQYANALLSIDGLSGLLFELEQNDYHLIGAGTYARPSCPLAQAYLSDRLDLGVDGYLCESKLDQIGIGLEAVSLIGDYVAINHSQPKDYFHDIRHNHFPIAKGAPLSDDDLMRQTIISELVCHFRLPIDVIQRRFNVCFKHHFQHQYQGLEKFKAAGWLSGNHKFLEVTDLGLCKLPLLASLFTAPVGAAGRTAS